MHTRQVLVVALLHLGLVTLSLPASLSSACSAVLLRVEGGPVMARSYDWHLGDALLMGNQPGIAKRALSFDHPAQWVSKYGSITINQYGRELPCEGMNQAGLAIAVLWLDESEYPAADARPTVNSSQWVQYQLDTASGVADVVASDRAIRITPLGGAKVHYFVSDASGDCAVIEFLNGTMVVHRGDTLPHPLITNDTCEASQRSLASYQGFGGGAPVPADDRLSRYVRLAVRRSKLEPADREAAEVGLQVIDSVRQPHTQWQVAYDLAERRIGFRTASHAAVRYVDLDDHPFDSTRPVRTLDIQAPLEGDVSDEFRVYSPEVNRRLVERNFAATHFTRNLPMALVNLVIEYPERACRVAAPGEAAAR